MTSWAEGYHDGIFFDRSNSNDVTIEGIALFLVNFRVQNVLTSNLRQGGLPLEDIAKLKSIISTSNDIYENPNRSLSYWKGYLDAVIDCGYRTLEEITELKENTLKDVKRIFKGYINNHIELIKKHDLGSDKERTYWDFPIKNTYSSMGNASSKANIPPSNIVSPQQQKQHNQMTSQNYNVPTSPHNNFPFRNQKGQFMLDLGSRINGLKHILSVINNMTIDSLDLQSQS